MNATNRLALADCFDLESLGVRVPDDDKTRAMELDWEIAFDSAVEQEESKPENRICRRAWCWSCGVRKAECHLGTCKAERRFDESLYS